MKYLKPSFMNANSAAEKYNRLIERAYAKYFIEYNKTLEILPKDFVEIYTNNHYFHDALVPDISLQTEYLGYSIGINDFSQSKMRLIFVDYDDDCLSWEILIGNIKEVKIYCPTVYQEVYVDCFNYDELLIQDNGYLSWEIYFSSALNIKVIFKEINIRLLSKEEIEQLKKPLKDRERSL
jgi:hypothetical protein